MSLPTYNKAKRRQTYEQLPKGAYVVKFVGVKEDAWPSGDKCLRIAFDIAEGQYKGFYQNMFEQRRANNENAQWPFDGVFTLNVPGDGSDERAWTDWNTFFADLEDSNGGFIFDGDIKKLKGKLIGGKFRIKQSKAKKPNDKGEYLIYNNTEMKYTCVAEDVRQGKAGNLPKDYLLSGTPAAKSNTSTGVDGFLSIPDGSEEELPF